MRGPDWGALEVVLKIGLYFDEKGGEGHGQIWIRKMTVNQMSKTEGKRTSWVIHVIGFKAHSRLVAAIRAMS